MAFAALVLSGAAYATPINGSNFGLVAPDSTIFFDEFGVANGSSVTTQYQSLGATFSPNLTQSSTGFGIPNQSGGFLYNFGGPTVDPFSILFTNVLQAAAFTLRTSPDGATLTAKLAGVVQESFFAATNSSSINAFNIYGFTGINFDEIVVDVSGTNGLMNIDGLQMQLANVPEPTIFSLLGLGLIGLGLRRRKALVLMK